MGSTSRAWQSCFRLLEKRDSLKGKTNELKNAALTLDDPEDLIPHADNLGLAIQELGFRVRIGIVPLAHSSRQRPCGSSRTGKPSILSAGVRTPRGGTRTNTFTAKRFSGADGTENGWPASPQCTCSRNGAAWPECMPSTCRHNPVQSTPRLRQQMDTQIIATRTLAKTVNERKPRC